MKQCGLTLVFPFSQYPERLSRMAAYVFNRIPVFISLKDYRERLQSDQFRQHRGSRRSVQRTSFASYSRIYEGVRSGRKLTAGAVYGLRAMEIV